MDSDEFVTQFTEWAEKYQIDDILNILKNKNYANAKESLLSIKSLDLSHKRLVSIPKYISVLSSLEKLNISHNQLQELPKEIVELKSLKALDISWNHIVEMPKKLPENLQINTAWNRSRKSAIEVENDATANER